MKRYAIIVGGGHGTRFGGDLPKQFHDLRGEPVLMHSIRRFAAAGATVVIVLPREYHDLWLTMCSERGCEVSHRVVSGGDTRYGSVRNGLQAIAGEAQDDDLVAIHDGVRPLASQELIERCYSTAASHGSAIPVVPATDSIRRLRPDGASKQLLRSELRCVQTPQTFSHELLRDSYSGDELPIFTDDATVVEHSGHQVTLVDGETSNIKITHPIDLIIAAQLLDTTNSKH